MPDFLDAALYFEDRARRSWNPAHRVRFIVAARKYRALAIDDESLPDGLVVLSGIRTE